MNYYLKPQSDVARLATLKQIHQKGVQDDQNDILYLTVETLTQIGSFIPQLTTALSGLQESHVTRRSAISAANTAVAAVAKHCRDIWSAVKRRTTRDGVPAALNAYYRLPVNGKNPQPQSQNEWLVIAEQIIQGEATAVTAGFPALAAPSVAGLQAKVTAAVIAIGQRDAAKTAYKAALARLAMRRTEANILIAEAMAQLRYALRKETAARRRDIMRGYGAHFSQKTEAASTDAPDSVAEVIEELAAPAAMSMTQPYAVPAVSGNGTAVHG